jgi:hypothetical protein
LGTKGAASGCHRGIPPRGQHVIVFSFMTLLAEASRVIDLRLRLLSEGQASPDEMLLMVTEKIEAMQHAGWILLRGGNAGLVIDNYRRIVAANVKRLSIDH